MILVCLRFLESIFSAPTRAVRLRSAFIGGNQPVPRALASSSICRRAGSGVEPRDRAGQCPRGYRVVQTKSGTKRLILVCRTRRSADCRPATSHILPECRW